MAQQVEAELLIIADGQVLFRGGYPCYVGSDLSEAEQVVNSNTQSIIKGAGSALIAQLACPDVLLVLQDYGEITTRALARLQAGLEKARERGSDKG